MTKSDISSVINKSNETEIEPISFQEYAPPVVAAITAISKNPIEKRKDGSGILRFRHETQLLTKNQMALLEKSGLFIYDSGGNRFHSQKNIAQDLIIQKDIFDIQFLKRYDVDALLSFISFCGYSFNKSWNAFVPNGKTPWTKLIKRKASTNINPFGCVTMHHAKPIVIDTLNHTLKQTYIMAAYEIFKRLSLIDKYYVMYSIFPNNRRTNSETLNMLETHLKNEE